MSKKKLPPMPKGVILPQENRKIEFTDIDGKTYQGEYIAFENMFFIGFENTGSFRFAFEVHNWKYIH